jgi:cytochrome c oxidase assembly protein subunit 15
MLHGCAGPLFFALTVAMAVLTSRRWLKSTSVRASADVANPLQTSSAFGHIRRLAIVTCILAYLQIVLGAVLRHVPVDSEPMTFMNAVKFHLFLAAVLAFHVLLLTWLVLRHARGSRPLAGLAPTLCGLLVVQILLGMSTWLVKYAVPAWAAGWLSMHRLPVQDGGWLQTHIVTAHVAFGSLILAASIALALYAQRLLSSPAEQTVRLSKLEAVR